MFGRTSTRTRNRRQHDGTPLRRHIVVGVGVCFLVALCLFGIWHLTRIHVFTIEEVRVTGGETISHDVVRESVDTLLDGTYFSLIPHRFTFLYPHDAIHRTLMAMPKVKEGNVSRMGKVLEVNFTEYAPFALWCLPSDETNCYYLDETGYAFAPGPALEGGALVRHVVGESTELNRSQVFDEGAFSRMYQFLTALEEESEMRVTHVVYTEVGDLTLRLGGGGELRMRNDGAYDQVLANLKTILVSNEFKHLEPGNFWYIDLRFGNKIFVNEEIPSLNVGTSTATTSEDAEDGILNIE